jgi:hypothetical protein
MPVTINGDGSITGLAVGGLPDGSVDADTLASNAVTSAKLSSGAITSSALPSGSIIQVQGGIENSQEQKLADQFTSGPEVAIQASSASNKILIMGTISIGEGSGGDVHVFLYKDGSVLSGAIGQAVGSATRSTSGLSCGRSAWDTQTTPVFYMETAGDTSSHTYKITAMATNTSIALNRQQNGNENGDNDNSHISYITAMEVKG